VWTIFLSVFSLLAPAILEGKKLCIKYIATSLLLQEEARGIDAAAVTLDQTKTTYII
jgi:hypothetical protein